MFRGGGRRSPPAITALQEAQQLVNYLISADCAPCRPPEPGAACGAACSAPPPPRTGTGGHSGGHRARGGEGHRAPGASRLRPRGRGRLQPPPPPPPRSPGTGFPRVLVPVVPDVPLCPSCRFLVSLSY